MKMNADDVISEYKKYLCSIGETVYATDYADGFVRVKGKVRGIGKKGELILFDGISDRYISSGEIEYST